MLCNFYKCTQCTAGPVCTRCESGYFLNQTYKLCMPCSYPCFECNTIATNCTSCSTINTLFYFDPVAYNCTWCYHKIPYCSTCNYDGSVCSKCNSTFYYLDSLGLCQPCTGTCIECTSATQCITCLNTSYAMVPFTKECKLCT